MGPYSVPSWDEILSDLIADGRTDEALRIAEMLSWNAFADELIDREA